MTCRELERFFVAGTADEEARAHVLGCAQCGSAARAQELAQSLASSLAAPAWSLSLRDALLTVPRRAITCSTADAWLARSIEGELSDSERERLEDHRSRCAGCAAAAQAFSVIDTLDAPQPAPWVAGRIAATAPAKAPAARRSRFSLWRNPRVAIALAYAAALILMVAGFNPADLARKAVPSGLGQGAKTVVAEVKTSAVDRIGAFEEKAMRSFAVWRGLAGGYGRAALSQAIQLVMKSEPAPTRSRSRNGEEKGALPKNETVIIAGRMKAPAQEQL
ncbi:MAG TPA: hypothetical protein VJA66_10940 [Thermoanaerobaculia bacterium]